MFISKDENICGNVEQGETLPSSAGRPMPALSVGVGRSSSSTAGYGYGSSCGASLGGTGETPLLPESPDRGEELNVPLSAANMRAKMLQQRQKALAKQRQSLQSQTSNVFANEGLTVSDVATPMSTRHSVGSASSAGSPTKSVSSSLTFASIDSLMAEDEEERANLVMPEVAQVSKEEETRNRTNLTKELMDRGICPVYDPTPLETSGSYKLNVDIERMTPLETKAFLHDPVPRITGMMQCRIVRDRSGLNKLYPKYRMETDAGVFLLAAQKQKQNKTSNYAITMSQSSTIGKDSDGFIGKLRSDFMGLEFVAYGPGLNPAKVNSKLPASEAMQQVREEFVAVQYSSSLWVSKKGPRKMEIVIPRVQPNGERLVCRTLNPDAESLVAMHKNGHTQFIEPYVNKSPQWNEQVNAYVLNFNKRVTQASVKNFQLCHKEDDKDKTVILQFGRVDKEIFNIDFRFPISPFQAFAICLSSFDYKLGCE
jgi:hypothetical protein